MNCPNCREPVTYIGYGSAFKKSLYNCEKCDLSFEIRGSPEEINKHLENKGKRE